MRIKINRWKLLLILLSICLNFSGYTQKENKLIEAAGDGNLEKVIKYVPGKMNINVTGNYDHSPLTIASKNNHLDVAEYLVKMDADIHHKNDLGYTSLLYFISNGNLDGVKLLMEKGAKVNDHAASGASSLMLAVESGNLELVKYLVSKKAPLNEYERIYGETALIWAIINRQPEMAKFLILEGAQVNATEINRYSPLMFACDLGNLELVELLVYRGADVNARDKNGKTALMHIPPLDGNIDIVRFLTGYSPGLAEHTQYIDIQSFQGYIALSHASKQGDLDFLIYIIENRKNKEVDYITSLLYAAENNHLNIVKYLLENQHVKVDIRSSRGETALIFAASKNHLEIVKYLVNKHADMEIRQSDGRNALLLAIINGATETSKYLINKGALLNVMDDPPITYDGEAASALMYACMEENMEIAKLLVASGADVNLRNDQGNDALLVSINHNRFELAEYLISFGAHVNTKNNKGFTPLMLACSKGNLTLTQMIVNRGAIINMINKDKAATALDFAYLGWNLSNSLRDKVQKKEFNEIIKFLKSKGAQSGREMMR